MAQSNDVYPSFHESLGKANIDLSNDNLAVALLDGNASFDNTNDVFADVSTNEISGDGYTAGGQTLSGTSWVRNEPYMRYKANDSTWMTNGDITAQNAVVYHEPSGALVSFVNFGGSKTASGTSQDQATFRIDWGDTVDDTVFEIEANPA